MTIATTLKTTMRGALLGGGVLLSAVIFATPTTSAHETNTIQSIHGKSFQRCNNNPTPTRTPKSICQSTQQRIVVSAITIYNRRHCHANGVCHKHRFTNPNHRH